MFKRNQRCQDRTLSRRLHFLLERSTKSVEVGRASHVAQPRCRRTATFCFIRLSHPLCRGLSSAPPAYDLCARQSFQIGVTKVQPLEPRTASFAAATVQAILPRPDARAKTAPTSARSSRAVHCLTAAIRPSLIELLPISRISSANRSVSPCLLGATKSA